MPTQPLDNGWVGWGDESLNPPNGDYNFVGFFYSGESGEVCQGLWVRDDSLTDFEPSGGNNEYADILSGALEEFSLNIVASQRLVDEADVPDEARREATGYYSIQEVYARGERLPPGLNWMIYRRGELYFLAIIGSG